MAFFIPKYLICPLTRLLFLKKIKNMSIIPEKGALIVSSNHVSLLDGFIIGSILILKREDIYYFMAEDYWNFPGGKFFLNFLVKHWHALPVKPEGVKGRGKFALKLGKKILEKGGVIVLLPEGGRSWNGKLSQGHTGPCRLSLWTNTPIIPSGIEGSFELLPRGAIIPRFWRGGATVTFGKPLKQKKTAYTYRKAQLLTKKLMKAIAKIIRQKYRY